MSAYEAPTGTPLKRTCLFCFLWRTAAGFEGHGLRQPNPPPRPPLMPRLGPPVTGAPAPGPGKRCSTSLPPIPPPNEPRRIPEQVGRAVLRRPQPRAWPRRPVVRPCAAQRCPAGEGGPAASRREGPREAITARRWGTGRPGRRTGAGLVGGGPGWSHPRGRCLRGRVGQRPCAAQQCAPNPTGPTPSWDPLPPVAVPTVFRGAK